VSKPETTAAKAAPQSKDLSGLMPYLRRYTWRIVYGLLTVALMGFIGNVLPLATGVMTDTLAGNPVPFEHPSAATGHGVPGIAGLPRVSSTTLARAIPFYAPSSRRTLGIYCLIIVLCVAIKGLLSFSARWSLIGVSRDIEFDIRNDLLKRLLVLEPEFYVRNRTGELMSRATNDLNAVRMVLGPGIMYSATTIVT
jgi:ABC-type multidrug transport system fused ATPase/permease subunit